LSTDRCLTWGGEFPVIAEFELSFCAKPKKNSKRAFVVGGRARVVPAKGEVEEQRRIAGFLNAQWNADIIGVKDPIQTKPVIVWILFGVNHYRRIDGPNMEAMIHDAMIDAGILIDDDIDHVCPGVWDADRVCDDCPDRRKDRCGRKDPAGTKRTGRQFCDKAFTQIIVTEQVK
jgi:hypothetical protein